MHSGERISWIEGVPMGINIRRLSFIAPHRHENLIEITLCLTGEIKFSYCYEEFTLRPGEFILVDKDVHYFHGGEAVCASFYVDLDYFKEKYPYIDSLMFVCEGTSESTVPHDTYYHKYLKSILLALLFYISGQSGTKEAFQDKLIATAQNIVELMMNRFDIIFYYQPNLCLKPEATRRYRDAIKYIHDHDAEKVTVREIAAHCRVSSAYMSEFLSGITLGFRVMIGYMRSYKSEKYLMDTDMSIIEISEACGFSDPKYYYDSFKTWYHCTPGQFRKRFRNEMGRENEEEHLQIEAIIGPLEKMMKDHCVDMFL